MVRYAVMAMTSKNAIPARTAAAWFIGVLLLATGMRPSLAHARQVDASTAMDTALQPDFLRRDLVQFQDDLRLDESQTTILETLFRDYEETFKAGADAARQEFAQLKPVLGVVDPEIEQRRTEIRDRVAKLLEETRQMRENMGSGGDEQEFRRQFTEKAEQLRQELRSLQGEPLTPESIKSILAKSATHLEAWRIRKLQLRDQFIANVLAMLSDEQESLWPALQRKLTRQKTIALGRLSGESVDVLQIVGELKLDSAAAAAIAPTLADYEIKVDQALTLRNQYVESSQRDLLLAMQAGEMNTCQAILTRQIQLRTAVRDVNDSAAQVIANALSAGPAAEFTNAYRMRGYSRIYRSTQAQRLFKAAKEQQGIDAGLVQSIQGLEKAFLEEIAGVNEQILHAVRTHEPAEFMSRAQVSLRDPAERPAEAVTGRAPIAEAFARRQAIADRYVAQLKAVLPPAVLETLPGMTAAREDG